MAEVIELPRRDEAVAGTREQPTDVIDEWGRDAGLVRLVTPLLRLRWDASVGGLQHLPARSGALLLTNQRRLSWSPLYVAWALARATGRPVRFVGRPDVAPLGAALQRLGALLDDPAEVRGALRDHQLVVLGAEPTSHPRHAGPFDQHHVAAALSAGSAVIPVASMSSVLGRAARVEVGAPIRERHHATGGRRRGPLAAVELAEAAQRHVQRLLDELGGTHTGLAPIDWLAEG
jgi:hypothetical protein